MFMVWRGVDIRGVKHIGIVCFMLAGLIWRVGLVVRGYRRGM